jgi:hypothetical protein
MELSGQSQRLRGQHYADVLVMQSMRSFGQVNVLQGLCVSA